MKEKILNILETIIPIRSTADNTSAKRELVLWAKSFWDRAGLETIWYEHAESPSVEAKLIGERPGELLVLAHLDVVPADDESFVLKKDGSKLSGRGVRDDKGSAAMLLALGERLLVDKNRPTVRLLLTSDEETGGENGAKRLVEAGVFEDVSAIFVPDGGEENLVVCKEKGFVHLVLEVAGKSAHGSRPWLGDNALEKAWQIYQDVKNIFRAENYDDPSHWHPTVNFGHLSGGAAVNQVPERAEMGLDIRVTEKYNLAELTREIKEIIGDRAKIKRMDTGDLLFSPSDHPYVQKYLAVANEVLGKEVLSGVAHGASDARHFSKLGVPIWIHYPAGGGQHGREEWVDLDSLTKLGEILEKFIYSGFNN